MEEKGTIHYSETGSTVDLSRFEGETIQQITNFDRRDESAKTARTSPAIINLISGVSSLQRFQQKGEISQQQSPKEHLQDLTQETMVVGATLLESFGNHHTIPSDPAMLLIEDPGNKRKVISLGDSSSPKKKSKNTSEDEVMSNSEGQFEEGDGFEEEGEEGEEGEEDGQYENIWPPYPLPATMEPLPISVTLPFIRAYANKKFDAPIPLFVPPTLPLGTLHHFPALLTLSPFFSLPTAVPLYPPPSYVTSGYYSYEEEEGEEGEDDIGFSQDESDGEGSLGEENQVVNATLVPPVHSPSKGTHISPLTTLASLASGTVKDQEQI